MWDERYSDSEFVYGTEPNGFLAQVGHQLHGPVLCLADGEGRNSVWLAERGLDVHAVDASAVGIHKGQQLAARRGVTVRGIVADLSDFELGSRRWGAIVAIFAHLPPPLRARVHAASVAGLAPGGHLVLEAYTPRQLAHGTGGPPVLDMLFEPAVIERELAGLRFEVLREVERDVIEGEYHTGRAAVLQAFATKP